MFYLFRSLSGSCEVRVDFRERLPEEMPYLERRAFMRLGPDLVTVNAWLNVLAADTGYSKNTVYEYAKVLLYILEWLALEPINISSKEPVGHSLLSLSRSDLRSLFAWLDIPARQQAQRTYFARTGTLPPGYRKNALSPATRNLRVAALHTFYDWVIAEYLPMEGRTLELIMNPLTDMSHPLSSFQQMKRPDGLLPRSEHLNPEPSRLFRRRQSETCPVALTSAELQCVLEAIPFVSHGRNAANRNGALIRLLLWGMLRREELIEARWEEVDGDVLWVTGKGRKRRAIPIADPGTWSYLQTYTNELRIPWEQRFHGPLIRQLDHEDYAITRHTVEHLMGTLQSYFLEKAASTTRSGNHDGARGFETLSRKIHSHIFRASGATFMARAGMSLIMLSLLLGHSDPSTTMSYYIAAEQLDLPQEVQRIFEKISTTLASTPSNPHQSQLNARSWYQRRGLIASKAGTEEWR